MPSPARALRVVLSRRCFLAAGALFAILLTACTDRQDPAPDADAPDLSRPAPDTSADTAPADAGAPDTGRADTADEEDTVADTGRDTDTVPETGTDTGSDATDAADATGDTRDADMAVCGNGTIEDGEACDDGNTESGDYCAADCSSVTGACGDGTLQDNESCDDGEITSGCDTRHDGGDGTCVPPGECADGYTMIDGKCVEKQSEKHVHIDISNTCKLSVTPSSVEVPRGQTISFTYHNHSRDYAADVWLSYGGGYLDLKQGNTWDDQFVHCNNANRPYTAAAEISINGLNLRDSSCPGHEMTIRCK